MEPPNANWMDCIGCEAPFYTASRSQPKRLCVKGTRTRKLAESASVHEGTMRRDASQTAKRLRSSKHRKSGMTTASRATPDARDDQVGGERAAPRRPKRQPTSG